MPGASGDPVRFANPFRRITEVGWNSVTHLAFRVAGSYTFENNGVQNYPPDPGLGERPVIPSGDWLTTWSQVIFNEGTFTEGVSAGNSGFSGTHVFRRNGDWEGVFPDEFEIVGGLPTINQSTTYDVLAHFNNSYFASPFQDFWKMTAGGEGDGKHVPGEPSIPFDSDTTPHALLEHNAIYTESPYWASGPGFAVAFGAYSAASTTAVVDAPYAAAGIVAIYKNRAYRGCATAFHEPIPTSRHLWILLKRSPDDDPSE